MRSTRALLLLVLLQSGCAQPEAARTEAARTQPAEAAQPSSAPEACSWFGDRRGDTLFFGVSGFWGHQRSVGAGEALGSSETATIGRFDLAAEQLLPPLVLDLGPLPGGVWDVLALPDGRIAYTALAEHAGWIEEESGKVFRYPGSGAGVNELAALPGSRLAMTQYFEGTVLVFDPRGDLIARIVLPADAGSRVAPKSLAFDPSRGSEGWIWLSTDVFEASGATRHDARAVDLAEGHQVLVVSTPELQNMVFRDDGRGFLVWADTEGLALQILPPGEDPQLPPNPPSALLRLTTDFHAQSDFAQDIVIAPSGEVLITLWSGRVFVVDEELRVRSVVLPRTPQGSLFYTAALRDGRVCATRCAEIAVVCTDLR